jgi:hypothetical protein
MKERPGVAWIACLTLSWLTVLHGMSQDSDSDSERPS